MPQQDYAIQKVQGNPLSSASQDLPEPPARVGFDPVDLVPMKTSLLELHAVAGINARDMASGLYNEGARGPTCRRMLCRDVVLSRTMLRTTQGLRNIVMRAVAEGREGPERLRVLEQAVDAEHRRLLASIELLARLEGGSPVVRVSAHRAAIVINEGDK